MYVHGVVCVHVLMCEHVCHGCMEECEGQRLILVSFFVVLIAVCIIYQYGISHLNLEVTIYDDLPNLPSTGVTGRLP